MESNQQTQAPRSPRVWRELWLERVFATSCTWVLLLFGSVGAVINALGAPGSWGEALGSAAVAAGAALMGRTWVVEAAVDGEVLRIRRLLPGRIETIPLSRIRSAQYTAWLTFARQYYITLRFTALAFAVLRGYGYPSAQRQAWVALTADLRQALGDGWHE